MSKIVFLSDEMSTEKYFEYKEYFDSLGKSFYSYGIVPVLATSTEEIILTELSNIIRDADYVIAISSSGNGIAIYANRISGYVAAPINNVEDIDIAIETFAANVFDIPASSKQGIVVMEKILQKIGG